MMVRPKYLCLVLLMGLCAGHVAAEEGDKGSRSGETPAEAGPQAGLREGAWIHRGVRDILGRGTDTTITLSQDGEGGSWRITYQHKLYPSVNDREKGVEVIDLGPYPVEAEQGYLKIGGEIDPKQRDINGWARYTFNLDETGLTLPAIVQTKPGVWEYRGQRGNRMAVKCDGDPFQQPVGRAHFPGSLGNDGGYYSYEEAPLNGQGSKAFYLRLLNRAKEGFLVERGRLIFDDHGQPRYERILSTGERSHQEFPLVHYLPVKESEP